MSKSLGNTYTIPTSSRGYRPSAVRYLLLSAYYRKQLNFTWRAWRRPKRPSAADTLLGASIASRRAVRIRDRSSRRGGDDGVCRCDAKRSQHRRSAWGDFRARAGAQLGDRCRRDGAGDVPVVRDAFDRFDRVLGVLGLRRVEEQQPPLPVKEIEQSIEDRHAARRRRDFTEADRIRDDLAASGGAARRRPWWDAVEAK